MLKANILSDKKKFFRLFPEIIHHKGHLKSTLNILTDNRVIKLGELPKKAFSLLEQNLSLCKVSDQLNINDSELEELLINYEKQGVGCFMDAPCFVEPLHTPNPSQEIYKSLFPLRLENLRINLSTQCDQNCMFCAEGKKIQKYKPCQGCSRGLGKNDYTLAFSQIQKALKEASLLGCRFLTLQQGNPMLAIDTSVKTIEQAAKIGFKSIEYISGYVFPEPLLKKIIEYDVIITFQVYSSRSGSHNYIARKNDALQGILENIEMLKKFNTPFNFIYLYCGIDPDPYNVISELEKFGPQIIHCDRIIGNLPEEIDYLCGENILSPPDINTYLKKISSEFCINCVLTLNSDGSYYHCPLGIDPKLGDVDTETIQEILAYNDFNHIWNKNMKEYKLCQQCEFYFACHLCKTEDYLLEQDSPRCGYNPITGEWQQKTKEHLHS